jgi:flavin-dependent dehydrogenase
LFERLQEYPNITIFQGERLTDVSSFPDHILARTEHFEFSAKIIAGADGVHSVVRNLGQESPPGKNHLCVGIRAYYENVTGLHPDNFIELIFLKDLLPGYFWVFPSTGGLVNAGIGLLQSQISKRKENLSHIFNDLIAHDPLIAPRFSNARLVGKQEAHTLPLGSHRLSRSGNRFLLLGDAAFLVDPFSGEGIGNAMASGEIAAQILEENFRKNDFSAKALKAYDARIDRRFSQEFSTMTVMQRLAGSAKLFNMVVNKARKNKEVSELLTAMFTSEDIRKKLTRPGFYLRLLFR